MSLSLVITLCLALVADEPLTPQKTAAIERETEKAQAEVNKKYGNRKSTELSPDERREMTREQAAAEKNVLEKNGVSAKQWVKETQNVSRGEYAQRQQLKKDLAEKEKAADDAAKKAAAGDKEIQVQRGISEENPVTLDEKANEDGTVTVEKSIPTDAANDLREAEGTDAPQTGAAADEEPAAKPSKSKGGKKR